MTYTLADAIRDEFERKHPRGKDTLFCDQCRRRKDREDFRETPWHGRAAQCIACERFRWIDHLYERERWLLAQERERTRMLRRYVHLLRLAHFPQRYVMGHSSADTFAAYHQPYYDAMDRAQQRWATAWATALDPEAFERPKPTIKQRATRTRLTKENR
ncbi:hypothetical protein [Streptomyces silvensis]|uniref:Uncharacterized protein n=1 Tax=Streptomyces silvensis TaxID=1765722 RepID=A0A0W7X7R7_9ACTN|nr:hypothetical protein [Streptomyces silvensis]KUF18845.1 hypothetical protein AT728_07365 [Streptomyces silvensis]